MLVMNNPSTHFEKTRTDTNCNQYLCFHLVQNGAFTNKFCEHNQLVYFTFHNKWTGLHSKELIRLWVKQNLNYWVGTIFLHCMQQWTSPLTYWTQKWLGSSAQLEQFSYEVWQLWVPFANQWTWPLTCLNNIGFFCQ